MTGIQQMAQNSNVLVNLSNKMVTEMQDIADEPRLVVAKDVIKSSISQKHTRQIYAVGLIPGIVI